MMINDVDFPEDVKTKICKNGLFDEDFYLSNFPEKNIENPLNHYLTVGWKDGLNPSCLFDTSGYINNYEDVADSGMNPLVYYCLYDWNSDRKVNFNLSLSELKDFRKTVYIEGLFDDNYYLSNYPEQKITDPLYHYLTIGSKEGKNPSKYFDTLYYTKNNREDLKKTGLNPLIHYCLYGLETDAKVGYDFNLNEFRKFVDFVYEEQLFDDNYYVSQYSDLLINDPLNHYLTTGFKEDKDPSYVFSTKNYFRYNQDVKKTNINPLIHFVKYGIKEDRIFNHNVTYDEFKKIKNIICEKNFFNEEYYIKQYPNLTKVDLLNHYLAVGWKENKDPSEIFSTKEYLRYNNIETDVNPLIHFIKEGMDENSIIKFGMDLKTYQNLREIVYQKGLFDEDYYMRQCNENSIINPLDHYIQIGWLDGKDPSLLFSTGRYLEYNADVASSGMNPLVHFVRYGLDSNRKFNFGLSFNDFKVFKDTVYSESLFVDEFYLDQCDCSSLVCPLAHYLAVGWLDGKDPSLLFSTGRYLEYNADVASSGMNPLIHFVRYGLDSNRKFNFGLSFNDFKVFKDTVYSESLFVDEFYLDQCDCSSLVCPLAHYLAVGWLDGKDPSLLFSTGRYLEYNADVASSGMNPLVHFVRYGLDSNRKFNFDLSYTQFNKFKDKVIKENLFNQDYYLTVYSDVPKNHALEHYLAKGYKEGKNPSIFFETNCFLENNKDIAESDLNPFVFYVEKALNSERKVVANLNLSKYKNFRKYIHEQGFFDDEFYLSQCSSKIIDPIDHYLKIGWKKGKNPSKLFSTSEYFNYNHDVEEVGINPLLHYVQYGHAQDRIMSYGLTFEEFDDFSAFVYDEKLFDDKYYLNQCENSNLIENPLLHYLRVGYKLGYDPSILFSTNHYKEQYKFVEYKNRNPLVHYWKATTPENMLVKFYSTLSELKTFREKVIETGLFDEEFYRKQFSYPIKMDILDHYITIGSKENKRPSIFFDQENYLKNNPDVLLSFKNPLIHYVLFAFNSNRKINHDLTFSEYKEFRKFVYEKGLFNDDYYLNSIDEKDILDPLEHYLKNSFTEKNNPSWFFNTKRYIKEHPDLEENDKIPLIDYVMDTIDVYNTINNSGLFDEEYYLEQAGHSFYVTNDPLMHFITTGVRWGFDPNRTFSINKYKEIYVDVDESKQNPLYHYLIRGKRELRDSFMSLNTHLQKFDSRYSIQSCLNVINALNNKISIIIPIYNAYEETRDCIISVLRNTHINYELILINDCSTDKRIDELLTSLESIKNIKIIRNEENQGFVKNVNLGMKLSENDVVLLNSDTIVTPHWLSHLVYSAYLSNDVGTVTPFSNSSDISIPELGSIKDFKYLNKSAYQIDKLSFNNNLSAPTGNGFCLFIKRELIEEIGYFDESFGRGYGEETDFTFRAYKNGWINVRNDAVFVYHRRHASFNEEDSNTLKQENKKLLEERYDDLFKLWDEFVSSHKIKDSVGRIKYNFVGNKDSERILYVTGLTNQKPILDDNFIKMKSKYDCFVLALDAKQIKLGVIQDSRFVLYNKWVIDSKWDKNKFIKLYVNVLLNLKIDLLYIKYLYTFYNPNNQDMSIFIKLLSLFEIPVLYEATVNSEELLENIDSSLHPMDSFEDLILKKSKEIDFNRYKMVVYTAITGNYDELVTPSVINPKFDYVCFTDNPNLKSNCWDIRLMEESELDGIRKARRYKILPHKYLKEYDYSFWIDANFDIIGDIEEYINKYSVNKKLLAIKHDIRDDIYDEADVCIHLEKDDPLIINKQIDRYKQQNYPKHNGLIASGILFRNHHDKDVIQLMNDWYSEVYNYSRRDQLSFNYVCWKNNFVYDESPEFYFKNQYFQRLLHVSTDSLSLTYNEENVDKILESFDEKTSIIVPIYNAYEETKACIESILNYTTIPYDLYLIDDCSTDERIKDLLSSYESYSDIHVITNKVNQGFVKNINLGFEKSSNDVVILNSDTEVTPKWLQKLKITAYSRKNIATVTPISNNAGAFSVPKKDEDNEIDSELGLLATSNIIEKISKKDKIYVPTGNGFCMYIRREAIYDVGFFDEIFGMGYCEENDFCMRALKKNWLHTVDFSTFIYHKHNVSFSSMKEKLFEENREILEEKHPEYKYELLNLVNSLDFNNLRDNISRTLTCTQKFKFNIKRILYLIHEGTGGTLHTSIDLMKNLPENVEAYLLTAGKDSIKLYKFSQKIDVSNSSDNDDEFLQHLYLISSWEITSDYTIKNPFNTEFRKIYFNVLNELKIDLVHIRHLIRHSFDMPYVAKKLGIPVVLSFHDFYYICPSHNLLDDKEEYCGGHCTQVYSNSGQCNISAGLNVPTLKTFVQTWRKQVKEMFENCDAFVTTSQSAYDLYTEFYPELKDKLFSIIEHGRDIQTPNSVINLPEFKDDESIRIVFPGHINANKGAALIKDIKKYDKNNLLEFHYMGNLNPKYKLDEIGIHHGYYKRSEFCKEIHEIKPHFIGLLSIWPETYCHTLTEGWSCGIPVISLDIGALGERIHKNGGGFFIENDGKKAYDKIIEISENYEKYKEVINEIPSIKFKTTKEMTEEYIRLYEKYVDLD